MLHKILFLLIISIIITLFLWCGNSKNPDTPEEFGEAVFRTFQKNNFKNFTNFLLTKEDVSSIFETIKFDNEKEKAEATADGLKIPEKVLTRMKERFPQVIKQGQKSAIKWESTKFENVIFKTHEKHGKLLHYTIDIIFSYKDLKYKIELLFCIKAKRGFVIGENVFWKGEVYN